MNNPVFQQAQNAYEAGDFAQALNLFNAVATDTNSPLAAGEFGLVYHQIGNCYVKLHNYNEAINAYVNAVSDTAYGAAGTVYYNLGMAYAYMSDFQHAITNFQTAVNDPNYKSKYKAYTAMGNALMKSGKSAEAGAVFRMAALDESNPDPTRALLNLGVCFMALGRCADAVIAYESAFQFDTKPDVKNRLNANLGQAYVATGQMQKAVNAFEEALSDKTYVLSDSASVDYQRAIAAVSKGNDLVDVNNPQGAAFPDGSIPSAGVVAGAAVGAAAGAVANPSAAMAAEGVAPGMQGTIVGASGAMGQVDGLVQGQVPGSVSAGVAQNAVSDLSGLDVVNDDMYPGGPVANNGVSVDMNQMPSEDPSTQGMLNDLKFNPEAEDEFDRWNNSTKESAYKPKKKRSGAKIFFIILFIVIDVIIAACVVLFILGYGLPSQEMVAKQLFSNPVEAKASVFSDGVSDHLKNSYSDMVNQDSNAVVEGVERATNESTVYVTAKNSKGSSNTYKLKMVRHLAGWKISQVDLAFQSQE